MVSDWIVEWRMRVRGSHLFVDKLILEKKK